MANSSNLPTTSNSMAQFLNQLLRLEGNALNIVSTLTEITTSSAKTVAFTQTDSTGITNNYEVFSIGHLFSEISRIDANFNSLSGINGESVTVRLPDGSFRKIFQTNLFKEPAVIGQLDAPTTFGTKNNWFFESFLNPLLHVSFDITKYVNYNVRSISYKRMILNADTEAKKLYFDTNYKGRNDLDYNTLVTDLNAQLISYFVDEDVVDLPISVSRFSGNFSVISYKDDTQQVPGLNGQVVTTKVRKYQLNTIKYTDNLQNYKNTQTLKVGDQLAVGQSTIYGISNIDADTNYVTLTMTSGTETIPIGVDVMRIAPQVFSIKQAQINVGFDERQVVFIKAIDPDSNLTTRDFSPGAAFYSNELVMNQGSGQTSLKDFYKTEVMDFGNSMMTLAKEGTIPAIYAETPDPPVLTASNFQVVLVNAQKQDTQTINDLKKKIAQKNTVQSEITQLEVAIDNKKQQLNTSKFNSDAERSAVQNQLNALINEKAAKSTLYASMTTDLAAVSKNLPPELSAPLYALRGFFPIPPAKPSTKTQDQSVIQFIIAHRKLSKDGVAPGTKQLDFIDNSGETVRGYFSNWEETFSKVRSKVYDDAKGIFVWADESVENGDAININQLSIPISAGEQIEIKIKSVSEAGFPVNPIESDWSSSVIIPFPDNLTADQEVLSSLAEALNESTRVAFNQDLASRGLDLHLASSFVQKDKYYTTTADTIASGFYLADGTVINLFQKLTDMSNQLASLQALIQQAKGQLSVSVIDPSGSSYPATNNSLVDLFAGYYTEDVSPLPAAEKKGAIITKYFKLIISNSSASPLYLASKFPGGIEVGLPYSGATATGVDDDYKRRRYDIVPLSLASLDATKIPNLGVSYQSSPFQSGQVLSQYTFLRSTDIGLMKPLVSDMGGLNGDIQNNTLYPDFSAGAATSFVWDSSYTGVVPNGNGPLTSFAVHTLHPDINDGLATSITDLNTPIGASTSAPAVYPKMVHAAFFNLVASDPLGKVQARYFKPSNIGNAEESFPIKLGFYPNDRYLIGQNTCGAYLYLSPSSYSDLLVNGTDYRAVREVDYGTPNQIVINIVFQYRMTDFFGTGVNGLGQVGGQTNLTNLYYSKKMGVDIQVQNESLFSFDIQVSAKYKVDSPSQTAISPAKNTTLAPTQNELLNQIF